MLNTWTEKKRMISQSSATTSPASGPVHLEVYGITSTGFQVCRTHQYFYRRLPI